MLRIWYVVGIVEYWLVPDYKTHKNGRFTVIGARLYTPENQFKGYWHYEHMPLAVKRLVRTEIHMHEQHQLAERKRKVWLATKAERHLR